MKISTGFKYKVKQAIGTVGAILFALVVGFLIFSYVSMLQDHGCFIGTTCISIMK